MLYRHNCHSGPWTAYLFQGRLDPESRNPASRANLDSRLRGNDKCDGSIKIKRMFDENKATAAVKRSYDRFAHLYDFIERRSGRFRVWREMLWSKVEGRRILEIGVGTGGNFSYYPPGTEVTGMDVSEEMLAKARLKSAGTAIAGRLSLMDAQNLGFKDNSFDTVVASLVFCSVPDPVRGLKEIERVVKRNGKVVLLEHVLSSNLYLALLMHAVNPFTRRLFGENFSRKTVENVAKSGLLIEKVTDVGWGIFKLIQARKG